MTQKLEQNTIMQLGTRVLIIPAQPSLGDRVWSQVAALHRQEISEGFLSSLSQRFLESVYRSIAQSHQAFLLLATDSESARVLGFICASTDTKRTMFNCLLHSGVQLIWEVLPNALSLRTIKKMFETLRYANRSPRDELPRAEILNFCVDRREQGRGLGRLLFSALQEEYRKRNVKSIKIVTGESQVAAQRFYESARARRMGGLVIHDSSKSVVFIYDIS